MTDLVDALTIEAIVGRGRHQSLHYGRLVRSDAKFYILHSVQCMLVHGERRQNCLYSRALDRAAVVGGLPDAWDDVSNLPTPLEVVDGVLLPLRAGADDRPTGYGRLAGHGLRADGAAHDMDGNRLRHGIGGIGRGACTCGEVSAVMHSAWRRRRWWSQHREEMRATTTPEEQ